MAHRASLLVAAILVSTAAAAADPVAVRVAADTVGASTRVILTLARPAGFEVRPTEGGIAIAFFDPIAVDPAERTLADSLVAGWRAEGPRTLLLVKGPGYRRHDLFELKNPSRIVVDVQGDRAASAKPAPARVPRSQRIVVLDPGHGGVEQGAVGPTGLEEKTVALDLARRLEILLERDGTTVVLTRDDDRLVPLDDRTATANHNRAELFVSIHLNSSRSSRAFGAETYFLSPDATDDEARTVAALENHAYAGDEAAPPPPPTGDGLELILWDLAQNRYLAESARLAETVQEELNALAGTRDRGIRQAPFRVLMGATMPAILVEVGFLSNPEEEAKLRDSAYRDKIAEALARAIGTFRRQDAKAGAAATGSR